MTAVIGILNKHGVAIAADSAVTRSWGGDEKCTKNGNKMLRLSNAVSVAVMVTGNADFLRNPWDVIIRRYRQERGNVSHPTVEACVYDLFDYISKNDHIWNDRVCERWIARVAESLFCGTDDKVDYSLCQKNDDGSMAKPNTFVKAFLKELSAMNKKYLAEGVCPQFKDYTLEQFHNVAGRAIQYAFDHHTDGKNPQDSSYPKAIMDRLKDEFEKTLMARLTTRYVAGRHAQLIFTGFGEDEEYPTLISVNVCEGFDHRVNYVIRPEKDIVNIDDERCVAICPFAQTDVVDSILQGMHRDFKNRVNLTDMFEYADCDIFNLNPRNKEDRELSALLNEVNTDDFSEKILDPLEKMLSDNEGQWEYMLIDSDLKTMAALAESLIDLTGFQRILTFQQEGVGGPVDVAVISKNDGFTWLSRKSWYHHKDINGAYGSMGV